jgi:glycosyltransferase involved in cell wall biosynthesis
MTLQPPSHTGLKVLHVLRAPVGGLFRNVLDLAHGQIARGHHVGLITDSTTGGETAEAILAELQPSLDLGLVRLPMARNPGPGDLAALLKVMARIHEIGPDVVHGHGAKGGLYTRIARALSPRGGWVSGYTLHGGSMHAAPPKSLSHKLFMGAERLLERSSDVLLFESAYIARLFGERVGGSHALRHIVLNGIGAAEGQPVTPVPDAADFVYVGELRYHKAINVLLEALAVVIDRSGQPARLDVVGSGPDEEALKQQMRDLGLAAQVRFLGRLPAREAFALGRTLVVPSLAESLPYVVLEAAAAGVPMIATRVGGVPEIFGPQAGDLVPAGEVAPLAQAMIAALEGDQTLRRAKAAELSTYVLDQFSVERMVDAVLTVYRAAIARAHSPSAVPSAAPR